ncbi:uncharacterized protein BKA55DRAFT_552506 [Fusarium redolens]|uniref:Uncharacterized protein n=1 Tax=Fusarium redolens TaxID=48865 RepID=A0A9P9R9F1_FUSRE|nr:uncharacterized protein BKA55DRAFT_552506 [Fusarium redolens]KAH7270712.1 hypothetical protein BKA55DRAFT_552506 [Fusarium redolens]
MSRRASCISNLLTVTICGFQREPLQYRPVWRHELPSHGLDIHGLIVAQHDRIISKLPSDLALFMKRGLKWPKHSTMTPSYDKPRSLGAGR